MNHRLSHAALNDLDTLFDYTALHFGLAKAKSMINHFHRYFFLLETNPKIGKSRSELGKNIRSIPTGRHLIYYTQVNGTLVILRIKHGNQDVPQF